MTRLNDFHTSPTKPYRPVAFFDPNGQIDSYICVSPVECLSYVPAQSTKVLVNGYYTQSCINNKSQKANSSPRNKNVFVNAIITVIGYVM